MGQVSVRDLRNHTAEVLRRVEAGQRLQVTADKRPVDEQVASAFARMVADARRAGLRPVVQDGWIAATAAAHRVPVYTQDSDFDDMPGIQVIRV